jgi:hypothetical protein
MGSIYALRHIRNNYPLVSSQVIWKGNCQETTKV